MFNNVHLENIAPVFTSKKKIEKKLYNLNSYLFKFVIAIKGVILFRVLFKFQHFENYILNAFQTNIL